VSQNTGTFCGALLFNHHLGNILFNELGKALAAKLSDVFTKLEANVAAFNRLVLTNGALSWARVVEMEISD